MGYLTACFAGKVVGVEHIPELAEFSIRNIERRIPLDRYALITMLYADCLVEWMCMVVIDVGLLQMEERGGHHMMHCHPCGSCCTRCST